VMFRVMQRNPSGGELCLVNGMTLDRAQAFCNGYAHGLMASGLYELINLNSRAYWLTGPPAPGSTLCSYMLWWEEDVIPP